MNGIHKMLDAPAFPAQGLNPLERFDAARSWEASDTASIVWTLLGVALLVGIAFTLALLLWRRWRNNRARREVFAQHCEQAALSERQRYVMQAIVKAGKLRNVEAFFTAAPAFNRGAAGLRRSPRVLAMGEAKRREIDELIESIRTKLALPAPAESLVEGGDPDPAKTEPVAPGDRLMVAYRGHPATFDVQVIEASPEVFVVQSAAPLDCEPGETWLVRYSKGGRLWEFDAPVLSADAQEVRLGRTGRPRFINRRRFPRVPTSRPAQLATFPFVAPDMTLGSKELVPGELIEIAGPGLRLQAPVTARGGDRVLLALRLGQDNVVEAMGKVRRAVPVEGEGSVLVVELLGLSEEEIAKLAHETNVAAHETVAAAREALAVDPADAAEEPSQEAPAETPAPPRSHGPSLLAEAAGWRKRAQEQLTEAKQEP